MDERESQEFSLEDIMKEFGSLEDQSAETLAQAEAALEQENILDRPEETPVTGDTIRMEPVTGDTIRMEPVTGDTVRIGSVTQDTVRLEPVGFPKGKPTAAQPIEDEEDVPAQEEEAFTDSWEPEYEQPIAEYVPPQPIIFHPRSRLRELKRKLVAGPEKRYYDLAEKGLGKLQGCIFLSLLVVLLSGGATVLHALGMVQPDRLKLMVFGQFLAMLISALLGSYQLIDGVADLFKKRFTLNSLLVFTFIACCADGVLCLGELRVPCCAAFGLEVTMALWSAYQRRNTEMGQMDTMRKATHLDSIHVVADCQEGKKGLLRGEGQVEDFMDHYNDPVKPEKVLNVYALVALCLSLAIGVTAGVLHGVSAGVQLLAVSLLAAMPATAFVAMTRPMAVLERRLHALGAVLCGWQGVEGLSGKALFPLTHEDLFPAGTVKLNGVKFYGQREPDQIVAYCAALIAADGNGLEPLFTHMLDSHNGRHYDVESLQAYEAGGVGGQVNGEPVLMGTLSFLRDMGVEIPEATRVHQAVYAAVDGELCGLFAITYEKDRAAAAGLATLCGYAKLNPVLTDCDFMLGSDFLRSKFSIKGKRLLLPDRETREALAAQTPDETHPVAAMSTGRGLAPFAYAVTGARSLKSAANAGVVLHMAGGILGLLMMATLAVLGALEYLTPANMLLYHLVWLVPALLVTEWTRSL